MGKDREYDANLSFKPTSHVSETLECRVVMDSLQSSEEGLNFRTSSVCYKTEITLKDAGVQKQRGKRLAEMEWGLGAVTGG